MNRAEIIQITNTGQAKLAYLSKHPGRYLSRASLAGAFIMVGTLISVSSAAWFYHTQAGIAKLLGAVTFSTALILITLVGGELFTGTNFILGVTLFERKARLRDVLQLWAVCYLGNLLGIVVLALAVVGSEASSVLMADYLAATVPARLDCSWYALALKGAMCNFLVCIGVFAGMKLKSESAKCIVIVAVITTFVLVGFEHAIGNMATLALYALLVPNADAAGIVWHLCWVTLGNVIGGAVMLALPVWLSAEPDSGRAACPIQSHEIPCPSGLVGMQQM